MDFGTTRPRGPFAKLQCHDPDCAIAYWGMAMANTENMERARGFIQEAVQRKEQATRREQLYIDAYHKFCQEQDDQGKKIAKKSRAKEYTQDLETIVEDFPDDIEAKAFLAVQLWMNERAELPIVSHVAINALIQDIFDKNPMHPAHHYRIHLCDSYKPQLALASSALCGPSLPGVAHMWHMPGHIYSKLHRYHDAVWQQEASARVDHAHMMRDRVMPDQIHNFAHNNEWLIRNLLKLGRVSDSLSLAKNMQELPRHPKYNTLKKGSSKYGRERLLLSLSTYRLWPELIELSQTAYYEPTQDADLAAERLRTLGLAYALDGQAQQAALMLAELESQLTKASMRIAELEPDAKPTDNAAADSQAAEATNEATERSNRRMQQRKQQTKQQRMQQRYAQPETKEDVQADASTATADSGDTKKAEANRKRREKERSDELKRLKQAKKQLEKQLATIRAAQAAAAEQWDEALRFWNDSDLDDDLLKAEWLAAAGKSDDALELVDKEIKNKPGEVLPLAIRVWLRYSAEGSSAAKESFEQLRLLASAADLETPLLARLLPLAAELQYAPDWAESVAVADDVGTRADLDSLGPFRWHPYLAPDFAIQDADGQAFEFKQLKGRPTLLIFYLGFGCLHCVEQLHEFSPRAEQFRTSGIDIVAVSTEDCQTLKKGLSDYSKPLDIPLYADPGLEMFKAYRCFDDFEQQPLHGTFLLDPSGKVLWQDISFEPFMDVDFILDESHRLLKLAGFEGQISNPLPLKSIAQGQ